MIKEIIANSKVTMPALVKVQKIGTSTNGAPFARGTAEDRTGSIAFICFEEGIIKKLRLLTGPKPLTISGQVDYNRYANDMSLQLVLRKVEDLPEGAALDALLPVGSASIPDLQKQLDELVQQIKDEGLKEVVITILSGDIYKAYCHNPAGMRMHHAYIGGLLEHSVSTTRLAIAMSKEVGPVEQDLIIAGALLHDIGKLKEISAEVGFPYTTEGRLLGHIAMGAMLVERTALAVKALTAAKREALLHIILSHHGVMENGSPVACATREAFIVHYADELDSVLNQFTREASGEWEYNKMLQRFLRMRVED